MVSVTPCMRCRGEGSVSNPASCTSCSGTGTVEDRREVTIPVPPGSVGGTRIGVRGGGYPGSHGGPPGDMVVDVSIKPVLLDKLSEEQRSALRAMFGSVGE